MRIFLTGASGWIGSALVPELIGAGHEVLGLARSDASADAIAAAGATPHRGSLEDLDSLRAGVEGCDGAIHTGYIHDFSQMENSARVDNQAVETLAGALAETGGPLVIASGTLALSGLGRPGTERDEPEVSTPAAGRLRSEGIATRSAAQGVRSAVVRLPPTVHGQGDHGFVARLVEIARERGASGYVEDGSNRWPAVHRFDAARLFRLAAESAPAGAILHGVGEEGVAAREIAEAIGRGLDLPVTSVPAADAANHFGWLGAFFALDAPAASALTRELLDWSPTQAGLIGDLDAGHYFEAAGSAS